jgi:hypothetical protein
MMNDHVITCTLLPDYQAVIIRNRVQEISLATRKHCCARLNNGSSAAVRGGSDFDRNDLARRGARWRVIGFGSGLRGVAGRTICSVPRHSHCCVESILLTAGTNASSIDHAFPAACRKRLSKSRSSV